MPRVTPLLALGGALVLGACAVPMPPGPTVMALPGPNKNFAEFQREDMGCRQYADARIGYGSPAAAANQAGVGSALLGTGLGAAAGALIGAATGHAGAGAAIGAGSGLLLGSAAGANNAAAAGYGMQREYNIAYMQCMVANGNRVPAARRRPYPYAYAPYGPYGAPPPYGPSPYWGY